MEPIVYISIIIIGIIFVAFALLNETKNLSSDITFRVIPFFSGFYFLVSQLNPVNLYFPIVVGCIGIYFIYLALRMKKLKNFVSKVFYFFIPFLCGIFLVSKCLHDINLI